ncbi:phosphotransferase [Paenibacillus sp. OSY-SE]|uniref:phosphotransferase n=1 Tax=Paenibacillus sp. OSY-SE TaxID=1196323 RepID=UPI0002D79B8A
MMKLSTMKKIVATLNENWQSPLGEKTMERWEHDPGSLYYVRSSANSVFSFTRQGVRRYLRFNDECERIRASIEAEMDVLLYLREQSIRAGQPVKSRNGRYVEEVPTQWGTFHATVFEAVEGNQIDDEQLTEEQFVAWGRGLGRLHHIFKQRHRSAVQTGGITLNPSEIQCRRKKRRFIGNWDWFCNGRRGWSKRRIRMG